MCDNLEEEKISYWSVTFQRGGKISHMCDITEGKSDITLILLKTTDITLKSTDITRI